MPNDTAESSVRLNKFIAQHLAIGRRQADFLIEKGKVLVNGVKAELGARVQPQTDHISVDGQSLQEQSADLMYVLLNKPVGYVCSRRQQGSAPTIYTLLPANLQHLKPVGRLDKDSSGLLVMTNDGDFTFRMTHPSFVKVKQYQVTLDKPLQPLHRQMIADFGVDLPDGKSQFGLERLHDGNDTAWLATMHEGRNRQIRRTFTALGYEVTSLNRIVFGPYSLDQLGTKTYITIAK